jgi:uncharacterized metal-binding protein
MKASLLLSGGFIVGGILTRDIHCIEYGIGALAGIPFSPDLDVDNGFIGDKLIRSKLGRVGPILEKVWDVTWHVYRKSLKHGGPLSHFPVVGTVGRIVYLYFELVVAPTLIMSLYPGLVDIQYELNWWLLLIMSGWRIILGLCGSDFIHWGLDILTTEHSGQKHVHGLKAKLKRLMY